MEFKSNITPLEQFFITGKKRAGATYEQIAKYKEIKNQLSKTYSLANAAKSRRIVRYCVGIVCLLLGFTSIVESLTGFFLHSYFHIVWMLIAVGLFLYGGCSLWMGFMRSAGVIAVYAGFLLVLYFIYKILMASFQRSLWISAFIIFVLVWVVFGACHMLIHNQTRKKAVTMCVYPYGNGWRGIDLDLKVLLPIDGYSKFITAVCQWEADPESLLKLVGEILRFSGKRKVILCGFKLEGDEKISLYFYDCRQWDSDTLFYQRLTRILYHERAVIASVSCVEDTGWDHYQKDLYPDRQTLLDIEADNMAAMLEDAGLDFSTTPRFGFTLLFADQSDSLDCAQAVKEAGYNVDRLEDHTDEVAKKNLEEKFSYVINISKEYPAGGEHLKLLTADVRQWAERFDGELLEWGLFDTFSAEFENSEVSAMKIPESQEVHK